MILDQFLFFFFFLIRADEELCVTGTNIPGKPREALNYAGGIPLYLKTIREAVEPEWKGFTVT